MSDLAARLRDCYCPDDTDEATCREAADLIDKLTVLADGEMATNGMSVFTNEDVRFYNGAELRAGASPLKLRMELVPYFNASPVCGLDLELCYSTQEALKAAEIETAVVE